jgi:ATP-binding cassette subfamily F protein 3
MLINLTGVCKYYGTQPVLVDVNLTIEPGEKTALVGPNGSGKTTLLRIILREVEPDQGDVTVAGEPDIGYLKQDVLPAEDVTVRQSVLGEMVALEQRLDSLRREISRNPDDEGELVKYEVLEEEMNTRFGPDYRSRVEKVLAGSGFGADRLDASVRTMSPGERTRLELARILVRKPEVLILDEPTNFLDIRQREWLERFLGEYEGTLLVVSHDRVFLNRTVNRTLDLRRGRLKSYEGGYDDYDLARGHERAKAEHDHEVQTKEIRKLDRVAEERRVWSGRREKTKNSAADSGFEGHRAAKMAKRASHADKRIEQMIESHEAKKPFLEKRPHPVLMTEELPDKRAVVAKGLAKAFAGRKVVDGASFEVRTGERVALVGPNGSGKTVLLRMLLGEVQPDKGMAQFGAGVKVGYFPQDLAGLDLDCTAVEEVRKSDASEETARTVLGTLLLAKGFADRKLSQLSAGERSKVLLARVLAGGASFLILDEPTNHLDIDALQALESLLARTPCGLLFASHDRALLEKLGERVLEIADGKLTDWREGYAAHRAKSETRSAKA